MTPIDAIFKPHCQRVSYRCVADESRSIARAMDLQAILERIQARARELGISVRQVSLQSTGSADTVRNWQRALRDNRDVSPTMDSLRLVAETLQVSLRWLLDGDSQAQQHANAGMAEEASVFMFHEQPIPANAPRLTLRAVFGDRAAQPATYILHVPMPGLGLLTGDVAVVSLKDQPEPGQLVVAELADGTTGIRRYLPPYLLACDPTLDRNPARVDQPGVTVRFPVIGSIRGIA